VGTVTTGRDVGLLIITSGQKTIAPDALQAQAAEEFAADVASGRMLSIRAIRARLHVGQLRAHLVRAYLATLAAG